MAAKLLLVEDNEMNREMLSRLLQRRAPPRHSELIARSADVPA